ncbi:hypothetical protein FNV43_RR21841 [Rhamnella rubrinervis]|uniref:Uncharacterized protein n=1 Tax=Rhamnella rubrinervis TaxID=2594499 RepID=A0A8K0GRI3_9ROSA|nr:hypothetical protein FNV43_RR21841 [Rhamnella rubrinervis]
MMISALSVLLEEIFCAVIHVQGLFIQNLFEKEQFVERNSNAVAAGRVPGIDSIEQITNRCIHIINTEEIDFGGYSLYRCPPVLAFKEEQNILCFACKYLLS